MTLRVKAVLRSSLWWTSAFRQWSNRDLGTSGLSSEPFRLGSHDDRFLWTTLLRMSAAAAADDVIDDVTWPENADLSKKVLLPSLIMLVVRFEPMTQLNGKSNGIFEDIYA